MIISKASSRFVILSCFFLFCLNSGFSFAADTKATYPRLLGMNIGAKNYDNPDYQRDLARLDVVILGFYRGWNPQKVERPVSDAVQALKRLNPDLLVGQYTIISEASDDTTPSKAGMDKAIKLNRENWWLHLADGSKVTWTKEYGTWDINLTEWTKPDFNGMRYSEWVVERDYREFFKPVPGFDIWYFDNVYAKPRVKVADWDMDGRDDSSTDERIAAAIRRGYLAAWSRTQQLKPNILMMGNVDHDLGSPEYKGKLPGAFLEGMMGKNWSLEKWAGWEKMMVRYHAVILNVAEPRVVGFNVWGQANDYRFFRYAFTSCLMDNGYFSFTDEKAGYSSVPWFDEYDVKLGKPLEPAQTSPWKEGVYRRLFEYGMVLINPTGGAKTVNVEPGYQRISGKQDTAVNNGQTANSLLLPGKDGIVLLKVRGKS